MRYILTALSVERILMRGLLEHRSRTKELELLKVSIHALEQCFSTFFALVPLKIL